MSNDSSWSTDQSRIAAKWLFGNVVETKVVGHDKASYFKLCLDVHDHLGEVQSLRHPGVEHDPGESQGVTFWQCF